MLAGRHALVMDFGVAKALAESQDHPTETLTAMGFALGTPAYMSPEQAAGQSNIDARSDLYAVGVLGYEMLSGKPPFTGLTPQAILASQVTRAPASLGQVRPEPPPELAGIIMRSLEKDPEQRWSSAEEMLSRLEQLSVIRGGRLRKPLLAGAVMLPLLIAAGWFGWAKPSRERHWVRGGSHSADAGLERGRRKREDLQPRTPSRGSGAGRFPVQRSALPVRPPGQHTDRPGRRRGVPEGLRRAGLHLDSAGTHSARTGDSVLGWRGRCRHHRPSQDPSSWLQDSGAGGCPLRFGHPARQGRCASSRDGAGGWRTSRLHLLPVRAEGRSGGRLPDGPVRGDEPGVQALRGRWRLPPEGAVGAPFPGERKDARLGSRRCPGWWTAPGGQVPPPGRPATIPPARTTTR